MSMHLKTAEGLPEEWSPAGLWEAAGLDASVQRGIDEFKFGGDQAGLHAECLPYDEALAVADVVAALNAEKTLSNAARRRILEALEID